MSEQTIVIAQATETLLHLAARSTAGFVHPFTIQLIWLFILFSIAAFGVLWSVRNVSTYSAFLSTVSATLQPTSKQPQKKPPKRIKKPKWYRHVVLRFIAATTLPLLLPYIVAKYFFNVAPLLLDMSANKVIRAKLPPVPANVVKFHNSIPFVADLHADSLMIPNRPGGLINSIKYGSPPPLRQSADQKVTPTTRRAQQQLGKKYTFGHVDLERLIQGNVALQTFSVVSQVPRTLNMFHNSNSTNLIGLVGLVSGWPTWALPSQGLWYSLLVRIRNLVVPAHTSKLDPQPSYQQGDSPAMRIVSSYSSYLHKMVAMSGDRLVIIKGTRSLDDLMTKRMQLGRVFVGALFSIEGTACCDPAYPTSQTGAVCAQRLYELGVRMVGLTHFVDVHVGGSSTGESRAGLSLYGREFVKRAFELGIAIDFAHCSDETVRDTLDEFDAYVETHPTQKPGILVSHTGLRSICDIPRNFDDELIAAVGQRDGLIGVTIFNEAHCLPNSASSPLSAHHDPEIAKRINRNDTALAMEVLDRVGQVVRKAIQLAGADQVAIGSDYDGAVTTPIDTADSARLTWTLRNARISEATTGNVMGMNVLRWLSSGWLRTE